MSNEDKEAPSQSFTAILARMRAEAGVEVVQPQKPEAEKRVLPPRTLPAKVQRPEESKVTKPPIIVPSRPLVPKTYTKSINKQTFTQIQVSRSQTGNPVLEHISYEMNSKIKDVDYVISSKCVVLFLSLKYHKLHPEYVERRFQKITYNLPDTLRVLLVYVDVEDFHDAIRELNKLCLTSEMTLLLGWSNEECATHLLNLKHVQGEASQAIIRGKRVSDDEIIGQHGKFLERLVECVSGVRGVSSRDAQKLMAQYKTFKNIVSLEGSQLQQVEGLGESKVNRLLNAFNKPFNS